MPTPATATRVKLLTGAPDPARLSWDESALTSGWTAAVLRFLNGQFTGDGAAKEEQTTFGPRWRVISTSRDSELQAGFMQAASSFGSLPASEEEGIVMPGGRCSSPFLSRGDPSSSSEQPAAEPLPVVCLPRIITALRDVPPAAHLQQRHDVVVVSLLVGVVGVLAPRSVRIRRAGVVRDLVELVVGDETATGMRLSFWFPHHHDAEDEAEATGPGRVHRRPVSRSKQMDELREKVCDLRPRDVVLVQNVALDAFQGQVFGRGPWKSIHGSRTRVELLARNGVDRASGLTDVEKVNSVKQWTCKWVNDHGGRRAHEVSLPPDTQ